MSVRICPACGAENRSAEYVIFPNEPLCVEACYGRHDSEDYSTISKEVVYDCHAARRDACKSGVRCATVFGESGRIYRFEGSILLTLTEL